MPAVISKTVLVLAEGFGESLNATDVADAIGRGLRADDGGSRAKERLKCDLCPLDTVADQAAEADQPARARPTEASKLLDGLDFDRRMRAARALVIARAHLEDRTLAGSFAFEAATRARQSGVPAYAITGHDALDPFEARIVDLQVILQANTPRTLSAAGRKLATLV
jgi:glycerate kinase